MLDATKPVRTCDKTIYWAMGQPAPLVTGEDRELLSPMRPFTLQNQSLADRLTKSDRNRPCDPYRTAQSLPAAWPQISF